MEHRHQNTELEDIGGEPLDGSGFEREQGAIEDEPVVRVPADQPKGDGL
jgi:hypothetical protein